MRVLMSVMLQMLCFGAIDALLVAQGSAPSTGAIMLFVAGELGGTSILCSLIVKQYRQSALPHWLQETLMGFVLSHLGVLAILHLGASRADAPHARGLSTLAWVELNLEVGLLVVLISTVAVLFKPGIRRFAETRFRKFIAHA